MRDWTWQHKFRSPVRLLALLTLLTALLLPTAQAAERTVLVMGDSLSAAYGLKPEQGWVALLGQRLQKRDPAWRVVNASVSGETTGGGAARIAQALETHQPNIVILELGANDALRGLPLENVESNLQRMIDAAQGIGARVLLVGLQVPPNYGPDYAEGFSALFVRLAERNQTALLPFLLEPIGTDLSAFQADTIHPNTEAQPILLDHLWPSLEPLLQNGTP